MSVHLEHIAVGYYIEAKQAEIETSVKVRDCSSFHEKKGKFCYLCGEPLVERDKPVMARKSIWHYIEDRDNPDRLWMSQTFRAFHYEFMGQEGYDYLFIKKCSIITDEYGNDDLDPSPLIVTHAKDMDYVSSVVDRLVEIMGYTEHKVKFGIYPIYC